MSEGLLERINDAVKAANDAQQNVATAQTELLSYSRTVGLLLLEAKTLHPSVKAFEDFLKKVNGLSLSRAYDLLKLAGGRTTDEELKREARERQRRKRERDKLPKAPKPEHPATTPASFRDVTETAEASAERRKAEYGAADGAADDGEERALERFKAACDSWLPQLGATRLAAARRYFDYVTRRCADSRKAA